MENYCETLQQIVGNIPAYSSSKIKVLDALFKQYDAMLLHILGNPAIENLDPMVENNAAEIGKLIELSARSKKLKQQKDSYERAVKFLTEDIEKIKTVVCKSGNQ